MTYLGHKELRVPIKPELYDGGFKILTPFDVADAENQVIVAKKELTTAKELIPALIQRQPVTEWRSLLCRFAWHKWTEWLINYDPPIGELGWTKQRRCCVVCGRWQEASLL